MLKNNNEIYGVIAKSFHWLIGLFIILMLIMGFYMGTLDMSPNTLILYNLHKATGVAIFFLVLFRLMWRLSNITPKLPDIMPNIQKKIAHIGHFLLYVLMVLMPLSGYFLSVAAGFKVSFFGLFTLPSLIEPSKPLRNIFGELHEVFAISLIVIISLHVIAALVHHFYYKDNILKRMLPGRN